jgi:hypothetical protein
MYMFAPIKKSGPHVERLRNLFFAGDPSRRGGGGRGELCPLFAYGVPPFSKIISRSFGCCPSRNLGNFDERQRLKCAPAGAH